MAKQRPPLDQEQKESARQAAARYRDRKRAKGYVTLQLFVPEWLRPELTQIIQDYVDMRLAEAEEAEAEERAAAPKKKRATRRK